MLDATLQAFANITDPTNLAWLLLGLFIGFWVGIIPGVGGLVGIALVLPFLYGMDPISGVFVLMGIAAINNTSDSFPAVIFGIPGGSSSAATIMDGHPLAQQGQAGRALGAAFTSSMIGGIIGAFTLLLVLPIARPMVLALGSPELLMLSLLALTTVGIISRGAALLGILAGIIGLALSSVGIATTAYEPRFTFGSLFLMDGLSLVCISVGLFGVPEMLQLLIQKTSVAQVKEGGLTSAQLMRGARDTFRNFPLVVRGGVMGGVLGMIPGLGGKVISWLAWGSVALSKKNEVPLGKGEIRGVIAPEAANNAVDGGQLVPTLMFGIPGSGSMAILLAGLTMMGVETGPKILESGLSIIISIVLALCVANIIATGVCFGVARWVSKLSFIPGTVIVPFLAVTLTLAVFKESESILLVFTMLGMGAVGWLMVTLGIPRVPLLIGFVLGPSIERYLWISMSRYGTEWLLFPKVMAMVVAMIAFIAISIVLTRRAAKAGASSGSANMNWR